MDNLAHKPDSNSDIEPDIRPHFDVVQGGRQGGPSSRDKLKSVDSEGLRSAEEASTNSSAATSETSTQQETSQLGQLATDTIGKGFNPNDKAKGFGKFRFKRLNRKRGLLGGGILGILVGGSMGLSILSGPLQFVHIAQFLQNAHFVHLQDAGDTRLGRLIQFVGGKGTAGDTRLGYLERKYKTKILAQLDDIGLKPTYSHGTTYEGFTIDKENSKSPYHGKSDDDIKAIFKEKGLTVEGGGDTPLHVNASNRKSLKILVGEMGKSKISTAMRVRTLAKYGLVSWHPLKKLDKSLNKKAADFYKKWAEQRDERLKGNAKSGVVDTTGAKEQTTSTTTDKDGNKHTTTTTKNASQGVIDSGSGKAGSVLSKITASKSLSISGGFAAAVGVLCMLRAINDSIGAIRYMQVVVPLINMGMDSITTGNQVMSGNDVDLNELGIITKQFNQYDKNGNYVSNWTDAASVQAESGEPVTGSDQIKDNQYFNNSKDNLLSWTSNGPMDALCSTAGTLIVGVFSFALGVFSGGLVSTATGLVVGMLVLPHVMDAASHWLAGDAVNIAASGAEWGNDINYGARLAGNTMALQFGGMALSDQQVSQLDTQQAAEDHTAFHNESLAYRIFNPYDRRTLAGHFIDSQNTDPNQNVAKMFGSLFQFGSTLVHLPGNVFTASVHADTAQPYDYSGIPEYGFSTDALDNPMVADPYANAEAAGKILDSKNGKKFIERAQECFGVSITKIANDDGVARWDVIPGEPPTNVYYPESSTAYKSAECSGLKDEGKANDPTTTRGEWESIRFFVFDTGIMEGYACTLGDNTSCANDGFSGADTASAVTVSSANSSIDMSNLYDDSTKVPCDPHTTDLGIRDGYHNNQLVKIHICALPNLESTSDESTNSAYSVTGANGKTIVNSRVSTAWYNLAEAAKKDGITLYANSGFRTMAHQTELWQQNPDPQQVARPGTSNHQMGLAIDFGTTNHATISKNDKWFKWLSTNAAKFGIKNYPEESWHWSPTGN